MRNKAVVWHHQASSQVPGNNSDIELSHIAPLVTISSFPVIPLCFFPSYTAFSPSALVVSHSVTWWCCLVFSLKRGVCEHRKDDTVKEWHMKFTGHIKAAEPDRKCYSPHPVNTAGPSSWNVLFPHWPQTLFIHSVWLQLDFYNC